MGLERIIVPIDFSDHAAAAAELAVLIARRDRAGVTLLHVDRLPGGRSESDPPPRVPAAVWEGFAREHTASLVRLLEAMQASFGEEARTRAIVVRNETSTAVVNHATECEADLIVMGSHGADAHERFLLGSVAAGVAGKSTCPVLITRTRHRDRAPEDGVFRRPLLAVDDAEQLGGVGAALRSLASEDAAVDLAPGWAGNELTAQGVERRLATAAASRELAGFDTQVIASTRRPASVLLERLEVGANDLVIVPARSVEREGLLGVIADRLLHHSPVPVLIPTLSSTGQES